MGHIAVTDLSYAHPGGEPLFFDVSFSVSPGEKVGLVGENGVGKSTLFRILSGEYPPDEGRIGIGGTTLAMAQDIGRTDADQTVREMLLGFAPPALRDAGRRMVRAERDLARGVDSAGLAYASAISEWGDGGGYELESRWDDAIQRVVGSTLAEIGERGALQLSGGERKRVVLDLVFGSRADIVLLDEPDNYLDIPAKQWMERLVARSDKTVLLISHDRDTLSRAVSKIITLEGSGCWVHGESYASYPEARARRQEKLGDDLQRWRDEERRLYRHYRTMKQRAAVNDKNAPKADAAESRWKRFVAGGPPPAPARNQVIKVGLRGGESARRALRLENLAVPGLVSEFTEEVLHGQRVGLIGPNGSGKTHLLKLIAGDETIPHSGRVMIGSRVSPGLFSQVGDRGDFAQQTVLNVVRSILGEEERSMSALARYRLQNTCRQVYETLSGGQRARLEILDLELRGHNLLLLDEPTDHLDLDSSEALESALESFDGSIIAVSHDRAFLRKMDRYLMIANDGLVYDIPDYELALQALLRPESVGQLRLARLVSATG